MTSTPHLGGDVRVGQGGIAELGRALDRALTPGSPRPQSLRAAVSLRRA